MSARIAGYILILQSEKNHDSVERLNLADRITEVEKANNLYLDLDTQRGIVNRKVFRLLVCIRTVMDY